MALDSELFKVDTAGWLQRTNQEKGPASIANARRTMKHDEVVITRQAVEEGRGNKNYCCVCFSIGGKRPDSCNGLVKARPTTFVAFMSGKKQLADPELRFLTRSLKGDFDLGGIPVGVMQRIVVKNNAKNIGNNKRTEYTGKTVERLISDK
ncbi:hypothetical protein POM88_024017 [Heracleum sosnowskyi]|uniref:Uncharacterized protein n=1 Tax=Heracleum sosnowskyi TaxID=360622 RepID=A0AAD8MVH5_9APIA|nr:hypothetical protein POM88_024017 [Heracleum sosnowskyi]